MTFWKLLWHRINSRKCPPEYMWELTKSEKIPKYALRMYPTLHYCWEFDGLVIDRFTPEWEYCSCLIQKKN